VGTTEIIDANVTDAKLDKLNIPLSGFGPAGADVDLGTNKLVNVVDPTDAQDAATKNYVDAQIAATADDDITAVTFDGTDLTVDEGATTFSADLSALEESADIATNTAAIAAHVAADTDTDETNELSDIAITGTTIELTNAAAGAVGVDLDVTFATNAQLAAATSGGGGNNLAASNLQQVDIDRTYDLNGGDLRFTGTGSMRIGSSTTAINNKLHVEGEIRSEGFNSSQGTEGFPAYSFSTGSDSNTGMYRAAPDNLAFSTGGTQAIVIDASQNVGIGIVPTERLHVDGNILATGTITPDYVFQSYFDGVSSLKPDYKMMSLSNIESFTRTHKHLPGVPSAADVKNNGGILINRSTEINLEKIEELFLHTIEQEKKIEALKSKNEVLAEELDSLKKDLAEIKTLLKKQ
jgi:hypothetical protein